MNYSAIFFDFDYTLGDATDAIVAGYHNAFTHMGLPTPEVDAVRSTVGYILADGYTILTGDADEGKREEFCRLFAEVARPMQLAHTPLCPGALELLGALNKAGVKVAVVSSKHGETLRGILDQHQLLPILAQVVGGDTVKCPKPAPDGILQTLSAVGAEKKDTLFCGDTVIDAAAAQNAGVSFCAVLNGTTPAESFAPYPCVHIAPDLMELQAWLGA